METVHRDTCIWSLTPVDEGLTTRIKNILPAKICIHHVIINGAHIYLPTDKRLALITF
jgi:hypothetical protein